MSTMRSAGGSFTVLGLQFGHDASAAVIRDGAILSYVLRERHCRTKHALTLDLATIELALARAALSIVDIDCVAITSTQRLEMILYEPERLDIRYRGTDPFGRPASTLERFPTGEHAEIAAAGSHLLLDLVYDDRFARTFVGQCYAQAFPEHRMLRRENIRFVPWLDRYVIEPAWDVGPGLAHLGDVTPVLSERLRYGFHVPVEVTLDGRTLPGYAVHHHLAHAASSYYLSGFDSAAVMTHDGFGAATVATADCNSGMFYLGDGQALYPLWPHRLLVGFIYEHVANTLGLGFVGAAGKLMGLAAYGQPRFFDERFVGNSHDFEGTLHDPSNTWLSHCVTRAERLGYDVDLFGTPQHATAPVNADTAASTQRLLEVTRQRAVAALAKQLHTLDRSPRSLCLSGGTALNCPSNSAIAGSGLFDRVFVEPACDDGGIAIGAALAVYHSILDHPRRATASRPSTPYLGAPYDDAEIDAAIASFGTAITVSRCDSAERAARDLVDDLVIGWFEGGSEAGPRALGHRSILADARREGTWARVNGLKGREWWRPLAPAVLEEQAGRWFTDCPLPSPYMLFNAQVAESGLPGVTHVDGTARIQTVAADCGAFHQLIVRFHRLTGVPVILNTSFNGPGEPIVETPAEAIDCFLKQGLDALFFPGRRIVRTDRYLDRARQP